MAENPDQLTFPGLDSTVQPAGGVSAMERAAGATLTELRDAGLLRPEHALHVQLVMELARAVGTGARSGRASAVAMAAKQLTETMALLPMPDPEDTPAGGADWATFLETVDLAPAAERGEL